MGKGHEGIMAIPTRNLITQIRDGVRDVARANQFANIRNGCIRIVLVPLTPLAETWAGGGLSEFDENGNPLDICEREFTFPIFPGGSHTVHYPPGSEGDPERSTIINCYAYTAMKVAAASWWRKNAQNPEAVNEARTLGFLTGDNGWALDDGVICATINLDGKPFIRLWVAVSGSSSEDDLQCASGGIIAATHFWMETNQRLLTRAKSNDEKYLPVFDSRTAEIPDWIKLGFEKVD